jgi:chemotaxis protein MotB
MAAKQGPAPIIIVKKKKAAHAAHHGGAWKVAYADFVTAMMALFIVLWLMNSDQKTKEAIGGYFKDPSGKSSDTGNGEAGSGENMSLTRKDLEGLKQRIEQALKQRANFETVLKDKIQMTVTGEGLRIEFLENEAGLFFVSGSPVPTESGKDLLAVFAKEIGVLPGKLLIEGHTDARPINRQKDYTNWELSSDRANAARRLMQVSGLRPDQVTNVRGYADQNLRDPAHPDNPVNRRITIVVLNSSPEPAVAPVSVKAEKPAKAAH